MKKVVGTGYPDPVSNPGNYYPVFHRDGTKYHQFWPVFASVHDVKQLCSSIVLLTLHSQTLSFVYSLVVASETTNIISCDAPTPPPSCGVRYLLRSDGI